MKKILSILVCVCVLLSAMVFTASAADGTTYTFSDYKESAAVTDYSKALDDVITIGVYGGMDSGSGYFNNELRIYQGAYATITSTKEISSIVLNAGHKDGTYDVSTSTDGSAWNVVVDDAAYTSSYKDLVINFATPVKYVKVEATKQMRVKSMTVAFSGEAGGEVTPPVEEPEKPATTITLVDSPVAGTAYKYGMIQGNVSATDVYYIDGAMSGYYMNTVTDVAAAVDVYLEEVEGGYNLYAMVDGAKKYINMVVSGTYVNGKFEDAATTVYTFDAEKKALVSIVNGTEYWIGTRNDKTYTTVGPVKTEYNGFYCQLYAVTVEEPEEPVEPDVPVTPERPAPDETNTLTVKEALELGVAQENSAYTADKYYVTGVITAVSNTQYGNMYIADEDGNEILVYGTYGADGEDRYDALESKPDEGDTVTVYGVVGNYNGTPQLKNAWIISFTAGELDVEEPTEPEADSVLTIAEAIELGLTKRSNTFTENKYYVTGVITEIYNEEYGNMRITDDAGNILTLYGTWEVLDEIRFDAMENKPAVGDTITVYGVIGQYNGTPQMKNGVFTTAPVTDGDNTTGSTTPTTPSTPNTDSSTTSPATSDSIGAVVAMAIAAGAVVLYTSKKR